MVSTITLATTEPAAPAGAFPAAHQWTAWVGTCRFIDHVRPGEAPPHLLVVSTG